jgi:hypothetical protein
MSSVDADSVLETAIAEEVQGPARRIPDQVRSQTTVEGTKTALMCGDFTNNS